MNFVRKRPIIFLIAGKAGSGKSTVGKILESKYLEYNKKVIISPVTKYLKKYIEEITKEEVNDVNKPRDLLQNISSVVIKKELGMKDFFVNRLIEDLKIYSYFFDAIIVPDVRFKEEIEVIKNNFDNVISIGIERDNYCSTLTLEEQNDITEIALDNYDKYDYEYEYENKFKLEARIAKELSQFIRDNLSVFQEHEKVIVYYDNGQHELNRILNTVLATQLNNYDIRRVISSDYRLFQVADLICTLELLRIKTERGQLSNSEEKIFHSKRELKRDFLKGIQKKEF